MPTVTYEGDNTVMYLQASRYALKLIKRAQTKNETLPYPFGYINDLPRLLKIKNVGNKIEDLLHLPCLLDALALRAGMLLI